MICPACQAENDPAAEMCFTCGRGLTGLTRGSVIAGRYEVQEPLGRGGMGMVYKARDRVLDETVAIKILRAGFADLPELQQRFLSEIKLARKVSHKNVCRIHEYGEDGGLRYISMAYVDGVDLKRVLRESGPLTAEEAYDVVLQTAEGLQAIHDEGIIHRDLKTPNIMRDRKGVVRLMDFGIAKEWNSATAQGLTTTGMIVGTPEYLSPEQAQGRKIDFRSDVYALGVVAYELFAGEVPFRGDSAFTTIQKHLKEPPPLEGPRGARLPRALVPVLRKALAKDPALRYASVREMADALRQARSVSAGTVPAGAARDAGLEPTRALDLTASSSLAPTAPRGAVPPTVVPRTRAPSPPPAPPREGRGNWAWLLLPAALLAVFVLAGRRHRAPAPPPASSAPAEASAPTPIPALATPTLESRREWSPPATPEPQPAREVETPAERSPAEPPLAERMREKCDGGGAEACLALGEAYRSGRGVPADLAQAAALFEKACGGGAALGCTNLAFLYGTGQGVAQDRARALDLMQQGCRGGDPRACRVLKGAGKR